MMILLLVKGKQFCTLQKILKTLDSILKGFARFADQHSSKTPRAGGAPGGPSGASLPAAWSAWSCIGGVVRFY